jgi:hypothetical protein
MLIADAQREVRTVFVGGFAGQLVSAAIWAASAAAWASLSPRHGILVLVVGGMFIFPITQLSLRVAGKPSSLSRHNPLSELAMEVAFLVPLLLPLAGAAMLYRTEWFYPACMLIVGAHYLPFSFLYGMKHFLGLGTLLMLAALGIALYAPSSGLTGAWLTSLALVVFAFVGRHLVRGHQSASPRPAA